MLDAQSLRQSAVQVIEVPSAVTFPLTSSGIAGIIFDVTSDVSSSFTDRAALFARRHFLWLLISCYALAACWPAPGLAIREWHWSALFAGDVPVVSLLLLAIMLFCAALSTDLAQIRVVLRHPWILAAALLAVWLGPTLLVFAAGWFVPLAVGGHSTSGLLVGLALVATMPVANSSVGWVQNAAGNLALALALVVVSISLSPWLTPHLLSFLGMSLSPGERADCERLVNQFTGWFFMIWVILPTAMGFACRFLLSPPRVAPLASWLSLISAASLLLLNYMNSATALPKASNASTALLIATVVLAIALSVVGLVAGWSLAWLLGFSPQTRTALMFGLSMKHTGLALILAGAVLSDQPLVILMIVLATLAQHLLAGIVQWWFERSAQPSSDGQIVRPTVTPPPER
jgi:bile acid:Na+ symporter, BASS family